MITTKKIYSQKKTAMTIAITIIFTILAINFVSAGTWIQYVGSPTSSPIQKIRTYQTYAMAVTQAQNILYYNGSVWNEIAKPVNYTLINTQLGSTGINFDKAGDGNFYWAFSDGNKVDTYKYDPSTQTWSLIHANVFSNVTDSLWIGRQNFECIKSGGATCYLINNNGQLKTMTGTNIQFPPSTTGQSPYLSASSVLFAGWYRWNGVSWINYQYSTNYQNLLTVIGDGSHFAISAQEYFNPHTPHVFVYNSSSGTTNIDINQSSITAINPDTLGFYNGNKGNGFYTSTDWSYETGLSAVTVTTMDFDVNYFNGWAGTSNSQLYKSGSAPVQNQYFNVLTSPTTNPTLYGQDTIFDIQMTDSYGTTATVDVDFYNSTGADIYGTTCTFTFGLIGSSTANCQLGIIGQSAWNQFKVGQTYHVQTNASDGTHTDQYNFNWSVIGNTTINQTVYNTTTYQTPRTYTGMVAIDNIGTNDLYAVAKTANNITILSFDVTNPNNMIIKSYDITKKNYLLSSASNPTSIAFGNNDRLFLGTDVGVYTFNGSSSGDATQLTEEPNLISFSVGKQYTYDITSGDDNYAWACRSGYTGDDVNLINATASNIATSLGTNPCFTVIKDLARNLLFVDKGTNGIAIYNLSNNALLTTITGLTTQPSGATHDRLSLAGTILFAIQSSNIVLAYNTANPATPTVIDKCYTNYEVDSIEAIDSGTLIAGTPSGLRVCDLNNSATFDQVNQYFNTETIKTYSNGEVPTEIITLDANNFKFAVAEGNGIGIYTYQKTINQVTTNNPPTINSITTSTNSPCVNQTFQVTIQASDTDNPISDLTYDLDCDGLQSIMLNHYITNTFTCGYSVAGLRTIRAWASDGINTVMNSKTITASVCNTTNFLNFVVLDGATSQPESGVLVNVVGQASQVTNTAGQASFSLDVAGAYTVTFSKSGYISVTNSYNTYNGIYTLYLEPTTTETGEARNQLIVTVTDSSNVPIPYATISVTDPITTIAKISQADATGIATILDLSTGVNLMISAGANGYVPTFTTGILAIGEVKSITMVLLKTGEKTIITNGRGCTDYINGIVLCSPLNISGTGDACQSDSDCLTDRCEPVSNTCSKFNWSICDARGLDRGNKCFNQAMTERTGFNLSNWILDNFLYVLAIVAVVIFIMMIIKSVKRN